MNVKVMTARELLNELTALAAECDDFDTLDVYVSILDRAGYEADMAGIDFEYTAHDASVYNVVVSTDYDMSGPDLRPTLTYVLIHAVELDDED